MSSKTFAGIKLETGICIAGNGVLSYGAHLTGVITSAEKSGFSILKSDTESDDDVYINTYILVGENREDIVEVVDTAQFAWFYGKEKTPRIPNDVSDTVRKLILKDVNKTKDLFKKKEQVSISSLDPEIQKVVMDQLSTVQQFNDLYTYAKQLDAELAKDRKASAGVGLDDFIKRYAFKEHILLSGPAGSSKTYSADQYLKSHGCPTEFIAGHSGIESTDLLGYPIRHTDGNFVWMDGPLTAAFRSAQTTPTGLFIDELLRIPSKELNILIGALTPNSSGQFVLRTNRIIDIVDGIGKSETLMIPKENLWVVATTNIGSNYDVEDMDLALNDRFITHDVKLQDSIVNNILVASNINSLPDTSIDQLMKLFKAINSLVQANELTYTMNVRHLTKVLANVTDHTEFKSYLFDLAPNVCSRTTEGTINEVELKIFKDTIKSLF